MSETVVFDTSAFIDLFEVKQTAYTHWRRADRGALQLVFPAAAMAEANIALRATYNAWSPLLWPDAVNVAPLDTSAAIETGLRHRHGLATSHVLHEAQSIQGYVLTADSNRYAGTSVPVLVL